MTNINKETLENDDAESIEVTIQDTTTKDVKYNERHEDLDSKNHQNHHLIG